ncbi:hypothetical protein CLOBOL_01062 [Enterocloster bolteae ATCC BAA-613]|uniref:Uncharacterized protein n=1 Tax=Enterocloster bolteae (strain ATCC BAA-613 / DSM 15670 / CCUG 46953 / JCM 12243 / WAL 16351) TaxID=411902 RepID=A8RJX7_ENTBW|nr:hypothetical protein CLOBOL_01062 [Enterocloster bolteae ATCC BAA-613]
MTQYIPFIPGYQYPLYNLHKKPCTKMVVLTKIKFPVLKNNRVAIVDAENKFVIT